MLDLECFTHSFHQVTIDIGGIFSNDSLKYSKSIDNAIPDKICYDLISHSFIGRDFNPFCEVVYGHQNQPMSIGSSGFNWSDDIHAPSRERLGQTRCPELIGRYLYHISMYLALVSLLNIFDAVYFHSHPKIPCSCYLLGQNETVHVRPASSGMHFFKQSRCPIGIDTSQ